MNSRRDEIVELRKTGLSYAKIGRRLGISRERIRQIIKGKPVPEKPVPRPKVMLTAGDAAPSRRSYQYGEAVERCRTIKSLSCWSQG